MALVMCPECNKQVSNLASVCPNCGFGVREFFENKKIQEAEIEEFNRTHKKFELDDEGWFKLFSIYDFTLKRIAKTTEELERFRTPWFDDGIPCYAISFFNDIISCLRNTHYEIIKKTIVTLEDFPDEQIKKNLNELKTYKCDTLIRGILMRWHDFIHDPLETNGPIILKEAQVRYNNEVIEKRSMGFGIITNSLSSAAFYTISATIKEINAKNEANANKHKYINDNLSTLQKRLIYAWRMHFKSFLEDIELLHKLIIFETGDILFKGYFFDWVFVEAEFEKTERKAEYEKRLCVINALEKQKRVEKKEVIRIKKEKYLIEKENKIADLQHEIASLTNQINAIGFTLFGEKAKQKKKLQNELTKQTNTLALQKQIYEKTKDPRRYVNSTIRFERSSDFYMKHYGSWADFEVFKLIYNENKDGYTVLDPSGKAIDFFEDSFVTKVFGAFREFEAVIVDGGGTLDDDWAVFKINEIR